MRVEVTGKKVLRYARRDYYVGDELEIEDKEAPALIALRRVRAVPKPKAVSLAQQQQQPSETPGATPAPGTPETPANPEQSPPESPEQAPPSDPTPETSEKPEKTKRRRGYSRRDMTAEE